MKKIKYPLLFIAAIAIFLGCASPEEEEETCEDTNTTKVTYTNTTTSALRVVVSYSQTPQYEPIDPIFSLDLPPGQSVVKEFEAGRYINTWYSDCSTTCNRLAGIFRDFDQCQVYEENQ